MSSASLENPRLTHAMERYLAELEAGQMPDRQEYLAQYADIADELGRCLHGLEFVHHVAPQLTSDSAGAGTGLTSPGQALAALGDYRILRELGRGGMGIVYEAEQLSLGRRVALKILPFASMLDARQLQRFKNEARAAAMLKHPHIVSVYAVGCERGVHYSAMELIEGLSLAQVIHGLRKLVDASQTAARQLAANQPDDRALDNAAAAVDTQPIAALSTQWSAVGRHAYFQSVACLGIQAAEALDYAHQMGVVHRDIKPTMFAQGYETRCDHRRTRIACRANCGRTAGNPA